VGIYDWQGTSMHEFMTTKQTFASDIIRLHAMLEQRLHEGRSSHACFDNEDVCIRWFNPLVED